MHTRTPTGCDDGFVRRRVCGLLSLSTPCGQADRQGSAVMGNVVTDIPELVTEQDSSLNCPIPIPIRDYPNVLLAHGSGGKLMHDLIERMIVPAFSNPLLNARHDGALLELGKARLAFTTDSYVVH